MNKLALLLNRKGKKLMFESVFPILYSQFRNQNQNGTESGRRQLFRTSSMTEIPTTTPTFSKKSGFATNLPDIANTISSKNEQDTKSEVGGHGLQGNKIP